MQTCIELLGKKAHKQIFFLKKGGGGKGTINGIIKETVHFLIYFLQQTHGKLVKELFCLFVMQTTRCAI